MKQMRSYKTRLDHLIAAFDFLSEKDQIYLETLASELAEIHKTAPETRGSSKIRRRDASGPDFPSVKKN